MRFNLDFCLLLLSGNKKLVIIGERACTYPKNLFMKVVIIYSTYIAT